MAYWNRDYSVPVAIFDTYKQSGTWYTTSNFRGMSVIGSDVKSGSSLADYRDRIRNGLDATTSYTRESWDVKPGSFSMSTFSSLGNIEGFRKEIFCRNLPDTTLMSSLVVNDASDRLKRKLREFTGQSNQLINIAELRELPRTIGSVANSASKLVSTVLNSKRRGRDLKNFASDQWLTWSFGVLPTLGAIDDTMESINKFLARKDHRIKEYGVHSKDWTSTSTGISSGAYHYNMAYKACYKHELSCKITAGYKYNLLSSNSYNAQKHFGFDISNVVPAAWELLPYSWLVDYFTTAGSFIEDSFAADFGQSIYLCQNVLLRISGSVSVIPVSVFPGLTTLWDFHTQPMKVEYFKFIRTPLVNLPRAPLRLKTTNEIASHAVNKLLNLTALLGSKK